MADLNYLIKPVRDQLLERACLEGAAAGRGLYLGFWCPVRGPDCLEHFTAVSCAEHPAPRTCLAAVAAASLDCLVVDLAFHWLGLQSQLGQAQRILKPGGRLLFSTFGPDTLKTARTAWSTVDAFPHVHDFEDLHHLGDALAAAGFRQCVMDAEWIHIKYPGAKALLTDLRGAGVTNVHPRRRKTLTGRRRLAGFARAFDRMGENGLVAETFEIIYGFARAPEAAPPGGPVAVKVRPPLVGEQ